ncbi:MAG: PAS domain-containing protein, partial [Nostocaceae cyanobacterium]|nr:PAS domain-containing protein [Nostocaceae cyanobacterium]
MDITKFVQQAEAMNLRLTSLYQHANALPARSDILPQAFLELGSASEMVQKATEELYQQNEELIQTRDLVEGERQHYRDLFEEAPDGYLVTNAEGVIQEANRAAVTLLGIAPQFLVGKHMINFIPTEIRNRFRSELNQLAECDRFKELV